MAFRVTGAHSRRTKIDIELPYTLDGEPVYDEDDQQIKGRQPVTITVPRFNFIPVEELKELQDAIEEVEKREIDDGFTAQDKGRQSALASLKPFLSDEQYAVVAELCLGELEQISQEWTRQSAMPLGESSASNGSSKSTRRQSSSTS